MRRLQGIAAAGLILAVVGMGCTIRYSQTMVGTIEPVKSSPITNRATGIEGGIGGIGASPLVIAFSEPTAANELMNVPCDLALSQVDYRGMFFSFYLAVNIP
jgi:hypothetical protein